MIYVHQSGQCGGFMLIIFHLNRHGKKRKRSRVKVQKQEGDSGAESDMEEKYEQELADKPAKKLRPLLPIKTKEGIVQRAEEVECKLILNCIKH